MASMVLYNVGFLCLLMLVHKGGAYEFVVGGQKGWSVPSDPNYNPYNPWAERSRFQIGDSLVFNYQSGQDSVLQVKSEDYANCNTNSPIVKYSDGHTVVKFNQSGAHYFISGKRENCLKNEKITVIVLADRSGRSNTTTTSPPPSPSSPSPSPTGQQTQSPPPSASTPTPSPASDHTPSHNAASPLFLSFAGSVAALVASATLSLNL
ncbi:early nodulin-like protein 3 [Prosopis cineraria]|uniref:early nodulin-like protein 3 n=1 Tax=Prosopis cineraria TaxID=364024 RepID=UPI0024109B6C|nr:early nodulin-like protein 3 [Prosopis cineraria]